MFDDVVDSLQFGLECIKKTDDFDQGTFMTWLHEMRDRSWGDGNSLRAKISDAEKRQTEHLLMLADTDPWSLIFVDWSEMSPNARDILDDPRDWSENDDFSPHGNDTGADIFSQWSKFAQLTPEQATRKLGGKWFFFTGESWEINLALAFGHIKKTGSCPSEIASRTHSILTDCIARADQETDWKYRAEFQERMERYRRILTRFM